MSNPETTVSEMKFAQSEKIVHQIPITKPQINKDFKMIYVEDALNNKSIEEYTYVTEIDTDLGKNYYGVKRLPFFIYDNNLDNYVAKDKANIDAEVVMLTPESKQRQIYSFTNGAQLAELSKDAIEMIKSNTLGKLIPHYIHSYEYIIAGEIPEDNTTYNLKFYGANAYASGELVQHELLPMQKIVPTIESCETGEEKAELINMMLSYSFSVPYTYTVHLSAISNNELYVKVANRPNLARIESNIKYASEYANENDNSCIYEDTFRQLSLKDKKILSSYSDVVEAFIKDVTYIKLDKSQYSANDIASNSNFASSSDFEGQNMFYMYDSKKSTYYPILGKVPDIRKNDIYAKCISYSKVSSSFEIPKNYIVNSEKTEVETEDVNIPLYIQQYDYQLVDITNEKKSNERLYYVKKDISRNDSIYFPLKSGINGEGYVDYYGYAYVELSQDRLKELKENADYYNSLDPASRPHIFIKQDYTVFDGLATLNLKSEYEFTNLYTYVGDSIIYEKQIGNSDYIFDIDNSGKTIYGKTKAPTRTVQYTDNDIVPEQPKKTVNPIPKEHIDMLYYSDKEGLVDDWSSKNVKEETIANRMYKYSLPANYEIGSILDYKGKWENINLRALKDRLGSDELVNEYLNDLKTNNKIYTYKPGYNEIDISEIVIGYDNVKFYSFEIGKIKPTEIQQVDEDSAFFMDVTKFVNGRNDIPEDPIASPIVPSNPSIILSKIDNNGFAVELKYYNRTPRLRLTRDLYMFIEKVYYTKSSEIALNGIIDNESNVTFKGMTKPLPIALANFDGQSLLRYMSNVGEIANETFHVRVRDDVAADLIANERSFMFLSYKDTPASEFSQVTSQHKISYSSTYYLDCKMVDRSFRPVPELYPIDESNITISYVYNSNEDVTYTFDWNKTKFYVNKLSHYEMSKEFDSALDILGYDKKFLYSKYYYPQFIKNNGLKKSKNGSYYSTVSIYDGSIGVISKTLTLQPNVFNVTEYTYDYVAHAFIEVDADENLSKVNENHYEDYYVYMDGETKRLSAESMSPSYYQSYFLNMSADNKIFTYKDKKMTVKYDGRSTGPRNAMSVQYFDNYTYDPKIIQKDNMLFGIVFHTDLTNLENKDDIIVDPYTNMFVSPMGEVDLLASYEYTVVNLKEKIIDDPTKHNRKDGRALEEIWQPSSVSLKNLSIPDPFYLSNEKTIEFDGTYHWSAPQHSYIFQRENENSSYKAYQITTNSGYWERNYEIKTLPLAVASYNFYSDPSEISSSNISYTFIPDAKILTAIVSHPEISYNFVIEESKEIVRFTYFDKDGFEKNYSTTDPVQENEDGTYTGAIIDENNKSVLVDLYKNIVVDTNSAIKKVVHQNKYTTYEYSTYKNAIALTNEKQPVLYSTQLIPATSHKVLYWNDDAESYAIKNVVDSNAYYSYKYYYDTIPFVTASYIYGKNDINIAYLNEVGTYINSNIKSISDYMSVISEKFSMLYSVNGSVATTVNDLSLNTYSALTKISNKLSDKLGSINESLQTIAYGDIIKTDRYAETGLQTLSELNDNIAEFKNAAIGIESKINDLSKSINSNISNAASYIGYMINDSLISNKESLVKILKNSNLSFESSGTVSSIASTRFGSASELKYEDFILELSTMLFSNLDFETDIIETEQRDENGNLVNMTKHKPNPTNLAKKSIYRADILWQELKKKNIVK